MNSKTYLTCQNVVGYNMLIYFMHSCIYISGLTNYFLLLNIAGLMTVKALQVHKCPGLGMSSRLQSSGSLVMSNTFHVRLCANALGTDM